MRDLYVEAKMVVPHSMFEGIVVLYKKKYETPLWPDHVLFEQSPFRPH